MLKKIAIVALAVYMAACTNEKPEALLIIQSTAVSDAEIKISLARADSTLITTQLVNGEAEVVLPLSRPDMIVIEIPSLSKPIVFFADVAEMTVTINGEKNPPSFEVTGSAYQDSLDVFAKNQQANSNYLNGLDQAAQQAYQASDSLTLNIVIKKMDSAYYAFDAYIKAFAKRNGIIGAMVAQRYIYQADYADLNAVYENIPVLFREDDNVKQLKERVDILKNTQVGMRFTDITQLDTTGNKLSISSLTGQYILIDFWASWCGPCRQANPDLVKLYEEFNPKGFEIVGVSLDQDGERWKQAIVDDKLTWYHMSDLKGWGNEGAAAYAIRSIPQSILIDGQGFIVQKNLSPEELREYLAEKLN